MRAISLNIIMFYASILVFFLVAGLELERDREIARVSEVGAL